MTGDHNSRITDYTAICIDRAAFNQGANAQYMPQYTEDLAQTLTARSPHAVAFDCRSHTVNNDVSATLQDKSGGGYSLNYINPVMIKRAVRRLTPLECERLQGYLDEYTKFGDDGKEISDAQRYRALGNSMALPCVDFVIGGIADAFYRANK
jgi:site-specific DNA-cytosine methylase